MKYFLTKDLYHTLCDHIFALAKANSENKEAYIGFLNKAIEIDTNLADDINKSVIKEQVELGVAGVTQP